MFEFELFMEIFSYTKTKVLSLFLFKVFASAHFFCLDVFCWWSGLFLSVTFESLNQVQGGSLTVWVKFFAVGALPARAHRLKMDFAPRVGEIEGLRSLQKAERKKKEIE